VAVCAPCASIAVKDRAGARRNRIQSCLKRRSPALAGLLTCPNSLIRQSRDLGLPLPYAEDFTGIFQPGFSAAPRAGSVRAEPRTHHMKRAFTGATSSARTLATLAIRGQARNTCSYERAVVYLDDKSCHRLQRDHFYVIAVDWPLNTCPRLTQAAPLPTQDAGRMGNGNAGSCACVAFSVTTRL
jgi:hypothetical protein